MAQTPPRDVNVGGFLPSSATRSRATPGHGAAPPPHFAVDAIDTHAHLHSAGPILSSTSPVVSRSRRSQPPSHSNTPHPRGGDATCDVRASVATLAAAQPGRLSSVGPLGAAAAAQAREQSEASIEPQPAVDLDQDPTAEVEVVQPLPLRPAGRMLMINALTNWGDPHFIGLCGIEAFDARGRPIEVRTDHVFTNASAPTSTDDVTKSATLACDAAWTEVSNLCSRPFNTTDANRMWLTRYHPGESHAALFVLPDTTHLGLLRIWNYNNGRVHTSRGVRLVNITLDDNIIFRGEIQQASGAHYDDGEGSANCETLVFTDDTDVLEAIAARLEAGLERDTDAPAAAEVAGSMPAVSASVARFVVVDRPSNDPAAQECESLTIRFHSNWGHSTLVGLSALRLLDALGNDIEELTAAVEAPPEYATDEQLLCTPLSALFDADPTTAWFARFVPGLALRVDLPRPTAISALLVANASICDCDCGAHTVSIVRNKTEVLVPDFVFRKAPTGLSTVLFQTVRFSDLLNSRSTGATVASSITARAAVGLRRAGMLQTPWPDTYVDRAPTVTLLPVGYVVSIMIEHVAPPPPLVADAATAQASSAEYDLAVSRVSLLRSSETAATPLFRCASTMEGEFVNGLTDDGDDGVTRARDFGEGNRLRIVFASETPLCLEGLAMVLADVSSGGGATQHTVTVHLTMDDALVFAGTWPVNGQRVVLPLTRNPNLLRLHEAELYSAIAAAL